MKTKILSLAAVIGAGAGAFGQSTIAYFNGSSFQVPAFEAGRALDLNQNGIADFNFAGGTPICTQDVPISARLTNVLTQVAFSATNSQYYYRVMLLP